MLTMASNSESLWCEWWNGFRSEKSARRAAPAHEHAPPAALVQPALATGPLAARRGRGRRARRTKDLDDGLLREQLLLLQERLHGHVGRKVLLVELLRNEVHNVVHVLGAAPDPHPAESCVRARRGPQTRRGAGRRTMLPTNLPCAACHTGADRMSCFTSTCRRRPPAAARRAQPR